MIDENPVKPLKIVIQQASFLVGDIKNNAKKIIALTQKAMQGGANLVVFPELALVGYPPEDLLFRAGFLNAVNTQVLQIAQRFCHDNVAIILGLPLLENSQVYNGVVLLTQGKIKQHYYKQSLPNYSVFDELRYFSAGHENGIFNYRGHKIGLLICEDVWQKKYVIQVKKAGAELLLVLNASPFHLNKHNERMAILQKHATQANLSIAYLNLVGGQDELVFDGDSLVVNAQGKLINRGKLFAEDSLTLQLDEKKSLLTNTQLTPSQLMQTPSDEAMVYNALVMGVKYFVKQNGFSEVVLGLSGGVDSALTLAVAVDALGASHVHAVMMPSKYTANISVEDAKSQADNLKVSYQSIAIGEVFQQFLSVLAPSFKGTEVDTTEENIQARCRGILLMAISNKTGRMVLTTGNKSEMAVGYATLYGDMCGGFAPLKDVSKTLVYQLCHYRNSLTAVIPERVLTREPSAELRDNQCDQDSLPDYAILDKIIKLSVEEDKTIDEIVAQGIDRKTVIKIIKLVQQNEHKRRQSAPGVRITRRAFGRDRRYPITSGYRRE